jgi:outer membrane biosynthesis protein TonB
VLDEMLKATLMAKVQNELLKKALNRPRGFTNPATAPKASTVPKSPMAPKGPPKKGAFQKKPAATAPKPVPPAPSPKPTPVQVTEVEEEEEDTEEGEELPETQGEDELQTLTEKIEAMTLEACQDYYNVVGEDAMDIFDEGNW